MVTYRSLSLLKDTWSNAYDGFPMLKLMWIFLCSKQFFFPRIRYINIGNSSSTRYTSSSDLHRHHSQIYCTQIHADKRCIKIKTNKWNKSSKKNIGQRQCKWEKLNLTAGSRIHSIMEVMVWWKDHAPAQSSSTSATSTSFSHTAFGAKKEGEFSAGVHFTLSFSPSLYCLYWWCVFPTTLT